MLLLLLSHDRPRHSPYGTTRAPHSLSRAVCSSHRYVCGLTPLKLSEFFPAYFLGALKATFLDAYLGAMLTSAALGSDQLAATSKGLVLAETLAIVTVSVLVSQFATQVFAEMLSEEGFEAKAATSDASSSARDAVVVVSADEVVEPSAAAAAAASLPYDVIVGGASKDPGSQGGAK